MATFNRNVITNADIVNMTTATSPEQMPKTLGSNPPAGAGMPGTEVTAAPPLGAAGPGTEAAGAPAFGGAVIPTEDDYLTKLIKYVPLEVLGAYLFVAGVVDSNVTEPGEHAYWLGGVLIGVLIVTVLYNVRVLSVVRPGQILLSLVGFTIYVFSVGGWFATTSWYEPWYATIALPTFGLLVAVTKLSPLPPAGS